MLDMNTAPPKSPDIGKVWAVDGGGRRGKERTTLGEDGIVVPCELSGN